ncbi:glucosaminidase domain-containing protein [Desulfuromonas sp. KJ2020]|uniref:glucosaminidase domain-containing protein n=1 Tax=Desulfuromonas sp. KJ2020 TaxID=2919173 RepID=UPI0020A80B4A|nr:glucosaminidase domain-containing protein [Desulfuromonas sp. KJ2020]MCP3177825.1 glucosaminidase domain-containing protein [Desulfuromonas sp. KJ2020]
MAPFHHIAKNLTVPLFFILLTGCVESQKTDPSAYLPKSANVQTFSMVDHGELRHFFEKNNYHWDTLDQGVPPFILKTIPNNFSGIEDIREKKRLFFLSILPMVLIINEEIAQERELLLDIYQALDADQPLSEEQKNFLSVLARKYKIKGDILSSSKARDNLRMRVDILPPSLVLAQAATESGYGTSRFAQMGNNLFGEWTFTPGTGLIPKDRPDGATYEVRRFDSIYESLQSYMTNINTHWAYRSLREKRAKLRDAGISPKGIDLATGLERYSERGDAYIEDIKTMIRLNRLSRLSTATLRKS